MVVLGGSAVSYERGAPVQTKPKSVKPHAYTHGHGRGAEAQGQVVSHASRAPGL